MKNSFSELHRDKEYKTAFVGSIKENGLIGRQYSTLKRGLISRQNSTISRTNLLMFISQSWKQPYGWCCSSPIDYYQLMLIWAVAVEPLTLSNQSNQPSSVRQSIMETTIRVWLLLSNPLLVVNANKSSCNQTHPTAVKCLELQILEKNETKMTASWSTGATGQMEIAYVAMHSLIASLGNPHNFIASLNFYQEEGLLQ